VVVQKSMEGNARAEIKGLATARRLVGVWRGLYVVVSYPCLQSLLKVALFQLTDMSLRKLVIR
jgi:hypothetical protein